MSTGDYERGQQAVGQAANPSISDGPKNTTDELGAIPGAAGRGSADATAERTAGGGRGSGRGRGGRGGGRRKKGRAEEMMVPDATFTSYYGRPVVKAAPWEAAIPFYLFMGGLAGGSSLLGAGADLSGRPGLRRAARIGATGAISASLVALVYDLGRPTRFINMLRVFKPTSPMSVGTWLITAYAPGNLVAGAAEVAKLLPLASLLPARLGFVIPLLNAAARPAGLAAALLAPGVASYTAVLLTDTSTPAWHDAHRELPFVFVGSAAAASGGFGMLMAPVAEAGPAAEAGRGRCRGRACRRAPDGTVDGAVGRGAAPRPPGPADAGQQDPHRRGRDRGPAVRRPQPGRRRGVRS